MPSEQARAVIEMLHTLKAMGPGTSTLEDERAAMELVQTVTQLADGVSVDAVDAGGVPAEWITPPSARPDRQFVYFHGGGYALGSLDSHRHFLSHLAVGCRTPILSVDYRLAPEHPFPAGLDDGVASLAWAIEHAAPGVKTIVGGDSAGGGLTGAVLLRTRERGGKLPDATVLFSPWTDLTGSGDSIITRAEADPLLRGDRLDEGVERYLQGAVDASDPLASPLFGDHAGLPPTYISVGDAEIILDDSTRLATRMADAGVDVKIVVADAMFHVYPALASVIPESDSAVADIANWLDATLD
ncbi:MAG TPA: alpha/beta hydrolase [Acidimicrobiales bacterium]|nr:alpha/beta hydrolase [Acidimicrobiales bacterium]